MPDSNTEPILKVEGLKTYFPVKRGILQRTAGCLKALDGVSFALRRGETLGLVGESGCGKTTCARSILRLVEPTEGAIVFNGRDVRALEGAALRALRRDMQIIFQDPYSSLNPRMSVASLVGEGLKIHERLPRGELRARVAAILEEVGLSSRYLDRYPHEFSGGQRQRIGIARALALNPDFIVCDEPVSALDVSIQAQIINLLEDLQDTHGFTYLFIAHDLSVVEHISDRVAVMYLGKFVETARSADLYSNPRHPYTVALLNAIPVPDPAKRRHVERLGGQVPSLFDMPNGCRFHPRCPLRHPVCEIEEPPAVQVGEHHTVYCHRSAP